MGEAKSPFFCADLNNFESVGAEKSHCILASPSLPDSCHQLGIKPVQLLIKSLNNLITEQHDMPFEAMRVMHESYRKEKSKVLQMCHKEKEKNVSVSGSRRSVSNAASSLEVLPKTKMSDKQTSEPILYADLCTEGKQSCRSNCSASDTRDPERSTISSFHLGNLTYSPATEKQLQRLTAEIKRKTCVTVSERDRKIAALMLVKHQEEQDRLKLSQQEKLKQQEVRREEETQKVQADKDRRRRLKQSMKRWHKELEARKRRMQHREKEKAGHLEQVVLLQDERWRRLKEKVEAQRREKLEFAAKETEKRKCLRETFMREKEELEKRELKKEQQIAVEKEQRAFRSKVLQEKKEKKRLQEENRRELLRHILLKKQVEQQVEEEEAQMRSTLEKKFQRSSENRAQAVEEHLRELQERAVQEEEQIQRAQLRAKLQNIQQLTHKQLLVQLSQRRMERASMNASLLLRSKAQRVKERNKLRMISYQRLKEKVQREEEAAIKVRVDHVSMKEWKMERLRRQQEQIQEEAQRLARASFHLRERVRQQTRNRTFDQMALEAQLTASISHMKL
ncbi:coiled-coil domain-containing protein 177 [Nothobranchius furzeri]|uniref:Coiled-coil domain-containing protein 177-like n=1 Tax=Nothobranchius furzeri TaxID=105023 RepID=A0A8C6L731_NOTFU|nr:coiled-coil domain-containing protein 177-like [Nothobranchius furzeri]